MAAMLSQILLFANIIGSIGRLLFGETLSYLKSIAHFYTYRQREVTKNIVVVGCSFAGHTCAERLARSLPSGWRVIVIEKNLHFGYTWLWPRISVLPAHEDKSFIPCSRSPKWAPAGAYLFKHGKVVSLEVNHLVLEDGERVDFEYLVLATGTSCRYPYQLDNATKEEGVRLFHERQRQVEAAGRVAIIGGGPVGVEIALDLKSLHPSKSVSLFHSRSQLCNHYDRPVHDACMKAATELGVDVVFNERPVKPEGDVSKLKLKSGEQLTFDLVIDCVGQRYGSSMFSGIAPHHCSAEGFIRVTDTLQADDSNMTNIFAIGDIADTGAPKMGRAAALQGMVAANNILRSIQGRPLDKYTPGIVEKSIDLTLGLQRHLVFLSNGNSNISFNLKTSDQTLNVETLWKTFNAEPFVNDGYAGRITESEAIGVDFAQ